jgi:hypothetical protein
MSSLEEFQANLESLSVILQKKYALLREIRVHRIFKGKTKGIVNKKSKILSEGLGLEISHLILQLLGYLTKHLMSKSIASELLMRKLPWLSKLMIW